MTEAQKPSTGWKPGQSGNPRGKKPGTRHRATTMVLALLETGAKEITEAVISAAKAGDIAAAKLVLDRLCPPARERHIALPCLPDTSTAAGISAASVAVLEAVSSGELTPGEGATLSGILEARRKALETEELEARIAALEAKGGLE